MSCKLTLYLSRWHWSLKPGLLCATLFGLHPGGSKFIYLMIRVITPFALKFELRQSRPCLGYCKIFDITDTPWSQLEGEFVGETLQTHQWVGNASVSLSVHHQALPTFLSSGVWVTSSVSWEEGASALTSEGKPEVLLLRATPQPVTREGEPKSRAGWGEGGRAWSLGRAPAVHLPLLSTVASTVQSGQGRAPRFS